MFADWFIAWMGIRWQELPSQAKKSSPRQSQRDWEVLVVDVSESPLEGPKPNRDATTVARKTTYSQASSCN